MICNVNLLFIPIIKHNKIVAEDVAPEANTSNPHKRRLRRGRITNIINKYPKLNLMRDLGEEGWTKKI